MSDEDEEQVVHTVDIGGQEVRIRLPPNALITGAIVYVSYQRIGDVGQAQSGDVWGSSAMPRTHAVGLAEVGTASLRTGYNVGEYYS